MPTLALLWGIASLIGMAVGFLPCLGALNWLNIPFAAVGLVVSLVAGAKPGPNPAARAGAIMCAIAIVVGVIRLILGGGVL